MPEKTGREETHMKKYTIITADGAEHTVYAGSMEAACVRFECCNLYPYQTTFLVGPEGNRVTLRYGHIPFSFDA